MIFAILAVILVAGGIGGLLNALLTDNGFLKPCTEKTAGVDVWRPGFVGNVAVGAGAALISWGLYGPLAMTSVLPLAPGAAQAALTVSSLAGAGLCGVGGARWLSAEIDKKMLTHAASAAAAGPADQAMATRLLAAKPAGALKLAQPGGQANDQPSARASMVDAA
jgi:hypothetical protein